MSRRNSPRGHGERGAAAVEFAFVLIPLITLVLGTIQFAWYFYAAQSASSAAREGARRIVVGECWDATNLENYMRPQSPMVTSASITPAPAGADIGDVITVSFTATTGVINFPIPGLPDEVTRTFEARLEDKSPGTATC